jgi:non-ribosomal peptide synthetase component E (peptide arylation enzyme)
VTLAQLLDRAAQRRPEAVAVVDGARRLTYAELAIQAAALGRAWRTWASAAATAC